MLAQPISLSMLRYITIISCALLSCRVSAQEIFNSIVVRQTDGTISTFSINKVESISVSPEASVQQCKWFQTLENPGIADYLRDFEYDSRDYSYHNIFLYRGEPYLDARQDWPYGVTLGDTTYYNLIPGRTYSLSPLVRGQLTQPLSIQTLGQLRMLRTEGIDNVRDLGGWPTSDGRRIKYGHLFRGTELNTVLSPNTPTLHSPHQVTAADINLMLRELRIGAELDLRGTAEIPVSHSALGNNVVYKHININYTNIDAPLNQQLLLECFRFLLSQLEDNHPVYIHCVWGADRTGLLCLLLEGLLGVKQSDIDKDYELTSFTGNSRFRTNANYQNTLHLITNLPGDTLQQKFRTWWRSCGATDAELDQFIALMLED